ncbi:MAG: N-acetyltransferase [Deltaproteobacteria bacterium]|nr:N-acetyltransferase [Deltaproteobacteria bacterium]
MSEKKVAHRPQEQCFDLVIEGHRAVLEYRPRGDATIVFTHTGVPGPLEGRGIGSRLVRAGLAWAREGGYRIVPACWFVAGYVQRHREYQDLLA